MHNNYFEQKSKNLPEPKSFYFLCSIENLQTCEIFIQMDNKFQCCGPDPEFVIQKTSHNEDPDPNLQIKRIIVVVKNNNK